MRTPYDLPKKFKWHLDEMDLSREGYLIGLDKNDLKIR